MAHTVCVVKVLQLLGNAVYVLRKGAHGNSLFDWKIRRATFALVENRIDEAFQVAVLLRVALEVFQMLVGDVVADCVWRAEFDISMLLEKQNRYYPRIDRNRRHRVQHKFSFRRVKDGKPVHHIIPSVSPVSLVVRQNNLQRPHR